MTHEDAFLQSILEEPDDDALRLIFADWLEERGDERGEFIRIQCRLPQLPADDPQRPALAARQEQLRAQYRDAWLGPLRHLAYAWEFRRGFVEELTLEASWFLEAADTLFRTAPIRLVRLLHTRGHVSALADCPHLRRLRALHLTDNGIGDEGIDQLAASPYLDQLAVLRLGNNTLSDAAARVLASTPELGRLTTLNLSRNAISDGGVTFLARSPYLAHLETLDLSNNRLGDVAVQALADSPHLRRLRNLGLSNAAGSFFNTNLIGPRQRQKLQVRFGDGVCVF